MGIKMNKKNLIFNQISGKSILGSLIASVIFVIIKGIFQVPVLNKSVPLWILIVTLILFLGAILPAIIDIKTKPKLVFYISSQFPNNQFQASLIQNVTHQFEFQKIHVVAMFPSKNLDAASQQRWFDSVLEHKRHFIGGLVIPAYLGNHKDELKKFVESFDKPVLFIDAPPPFEEGEFPKNSAFVGYDNFEGGKLAAEAMCHELNKLNDSNFRVLIIASNVVSERQKGFKKHLDEIMNQQLSEVKCMVECIDDGQFRREDGARIFENALRLKNSDCSSYQGIFCTNDEMALGVMSKINDIPHFPKEEVVIIGYDAIPDTEVIELIKYRETPIKNSVKQEPDKLASRGVEKLLKMIKGEKVKKCEKISPTLYLKIPRKPGRCEEA
jgi:ribose transport system substrate-binding protein